MADVHEVPLLPTEKQCLYQPPLEELASAIQYGMRNNFETVSVSVTDCPDLTQIPFGLAEKGICGRPKLLDVGGVPYLIPKPDLSRIYNFDVLANLIGNEDAFFIGAGAGGCHILGVNSEMMPNVKLNKNGR